MEGIHRQLLQDTSTGDVVGPFFGFMGAAAALIFACKFDPIRFKCVTGAVDFKNPRALLARQLLPLILITTGPVTKFGQHCSGELSFTVCAPTCRFWSSIWYSQVWCWNCLYGCDEARVGDEVHCTSCHGWCAWYLRSDYCCHYQHRK